MMINFLESINHRLAGCTGVPRETLRKIWRLNVSRVSTSRIIDDSFAIDSPEESIDPSHYLSTKRFEAVDLRRRAGESL